MNKKIFATIMAGTMVLGMTACDNKPATVVTETTTEVTETTPAETTTEETTAIEITPEMQQLSAGMVYDGLSDVDFGNAVFETETGDDGVAYVVGYPKYAEGQDVVITFKCSDFLNLHRTYKYALDMGIDLGQAVGLWEMTGGEDIQYDITNIADKCTLTNADGVYTLTVPAEYITRNYGFQVNLDAGDGKGFCILFCCVA